MAHQFVDEISWECVRDIIAIVRSGDVGRDKQLEIAQHACWFIGCGCETLKSDPDVVGNVKGLDLAEAADELEALIGQSPDAVKAIDWIKVIELLLPLLFIIFKGDEDA